MEHNSRREDPWNKKTKISQKYNSNTQTFLFDKFYNQKKYSHKSNPHINRISQSINICNRIIFVIHIKPDRTKIQNPLNRSGLIRMLCGKISVIPVHLLLKFSKSLNYCVIGIGRSMFSGKKRKIGSEIN